MRQPLRNSLAFLLAAGGIGLCGYGGLLWRELPRYSEPEIQASVKLNLAADIARLGPSNRPDDAQIEVMRAQVRKEVEADIAGEQAWPWQWIRSGLVITGFALLLAWPTLFRSRGK